MASLNTTRSTASCSSLHSIQVDRSLRQYTTRELFADIEFVGSQGKNGPASSPSMELELRRHKHLCRSLQLEDLNAGKVERIWRGFCKELESQLSERDNLKNKAVQVLPLGKFFYSASSGKVAFVVSQGFARTYRVRQRHALVPIDCPTADLNYSALAHKTGFSKDEVKFALSEAFLCIGSAIKRAECPLVVSFGGLGMLYADTHRLRFSFGKRMNTDKRPLHTKEIERVSLFGRNLTGGGSASNEGLVQKVSVEEDVAMDVPPLDLTFRGKVALKLDEAQLEGLPEVEEDQESVGPAQPDTSEYLIQAPYFNNAPLDERKRHGPKVERNMKLAFERAAADLLEEAKRLEKEEKDAETRAKRSEVEYKKKLLTSKKEQRNVNSYLIRQTKERKERTAEERRERSMGMAPLDNTGKTTPFPVEIPPDVKVELRKKKQLRRALDHQISEKKKKHLNETVEAINRERYVVECNRKIMEDDRQRRLYHKYRQRKALQYEWSRQCKVAKLQRQLKEAEAKKEALELLTVRSAFEGPKMPS